MAHMGERGASGCSRSGGAASTQMDDLEVCSFCSGDFVCFDDVSVFPGQAYGKRQSGSQQSPDGGMYSVEWSSDRLQEMMCPPLPGQVPVEPTVTSTHRTAQGAVEASPANKNSTEKPTERRKRKGIRSFLMRVWKAMKQHFGCCCHSSAGDVVEPFVPPADLDPEPEPDHPAVKLLTLVEFFSSESLNMEDLSDRE
ncbi:hypothetical protein PO909_017276 [Leuciscus waleckii]